MYILQHPGSSLSVLQACLDSRHPAQCSDATPSSLKSQGYHANLIIEFESIPEQPLAWIGAGPLQEQNARERQPCHEIVATHASKPS